MLGVGVECKGVCKGHAHGFNLGVELAGVVPVAREAIWVGCFQKVEAYECCNTLCGCGVILKGFLCTGGKATRQEVVKHSRGLVHHVYVQEALMGHTP